MQDNGKTVAECRSQAAAAAAVVRYYAAVCETFEDAITPARGDFLSLSTHEPVGVVAAVTPWNSPLTLEAQKFAPILAAGNALILKPSEITPQVSLRYADLAARAGFPPGVFNVLTGFGRPLGEALVRHPGVDMITFTGGTATGRLVAGMAAERLIPVMLELGGKSPNVVFDDADVEHAVAGAATASSRAAVSRALPGPASSCTTPPTIGSSLAWSRWRSGCASGRRRIRQPRWRRWRAFRIASRSSDRCSAPAPRGPSCCPADAAGRSPRCNPAPTSRRPFWRSTTTGWRLPRRRYSVRWLRVLRFRDEDDLVQQANDTVFGLACGLWTADYKKALRVARRIKAGTVWVNTYRQVSISTPFGGVKASGLGREKGIEGMRVYMAQKSIYLGLNERPIAWP